MKSILLLSLIALCSSAYATQPATPASPHQGMKMMPMSAPEIPLTQQGTVKSAINVPMYTYIEADLGKKTIWLATSTVAVKKGDTIHFDEGMVMTNFYSKSLKRSFPSIVFVNRAVVANAKK
jgi:hypothetical protein